MNEEKTDSKENERKISELIKSDKYKKISTDLFKKYSSQVHAIKILIISMAVGLLLIFCMWIPMVWEKTSVYLFGGLKIFIVLAIYGSIRAFLSDKRKIDTINDMESLKCYLYYVSHSTSTRFCYSSTLYWISKRIEERYNNPLYGQEETFSKTINQLYPILKPFSNKNGRCSASYRREEFKTIAKDIVCDKDASGRIKKFIDQATDTNYDFTITDFQMFVTHNLSMPVYSIVILIHIIAIILNNVDGNITLNSIFQKEVFIDILYNIPQDFLPLLIYYGIIKETKE